MEKLAGSPHRGKRLQRSPGLKNRAIASGLIHHEAIRLSPKSQLSSPS
ncbi:hypothetical protein [Laspinema olomoucense]|nr:MULTISPECIES: hypothetical protein [unclassified Laspinema]MCT7975790.1 hypothetical protein [Laspinema sp. D3d]